MSQFFQLHPDNPQQRLVRQAVDIIRAGGVVVYPTDSAYALGCHIGDKSALDRIRRILQAMERSGAVGGFRGNLPSPIPWRKNDFARLWRRRLAMIGAALVILAVYLSAYLNVRTIKAPPVSG